MPHYAWFREHSWIVWIEYSSIPSSPVFCFVKKCLSCECSEHSAIILHYVPFATIRYPSIFWRNKGRDSKESTNILSILFMNVRQIIHSVTRRNRRIFNPYYLRIMNESRIFAKSYIVEVDLLLLNILIILIIIFLQHFVICICILYIIKLHWKMDLVE